jgi:two-component system response regulator AtoC
MKERILVVDDDPSILETFEHHLSRSGYDVTTAATAEAALDIVPSFEPSLVITDVRMPGMDGIALLERLHSQLEDVDVIVITAFEGMSTAVSAMKAGAYDYLVKPPDLDQIDLLVERCFRDRSLRRRIRHLSAEASEGHEIDRLVGRDAKMIEIYKLIGVLAENQATVLITGETGTGKERIARAIHFNSPRAADPFIAVNCTALAETLLESELFGHAKGAFTGAVESRKGYFELAEEGTIFLDEIGDSGPEFQAKLLRVLEKQEFFPVGGEHPRLTKARVIASTQDPLEDLVREGRFREDLYFRLKVVEIKVPRLRERKVDIPLLTEHFLAKISGELHKGIRGLSNEAMHLLETYDWPGNVRELENVLTRAVVLARGPVIDRELISLGAPYLDGDQEKAPEPVDSTLEAVEAAHVQHILEQTQGNKREAARLLGISRPRLDRLIEKHELSVP